MTTVAADLDRCLFEAHVTLFLPVRVDDAPTWLDGPLPLSQGRTTADREGRSSYFFPSAATRLYGDRTTPSRWHQMMPEGRPDRLVAIEVMRAFDDRGFALAHYRYDRVGGSALVRRDGIDQESVLECLPAGVTAGGSHPRYMTMVTAFPLQQLSPAMDGDYSSWTPHQQWLWLLASGTLPEDFSPDPLDRSDVDDGRVSLSADWSGLVLRDGVALVGVGTRFKEWGLLYGATLFADAVLLGEMQRAMAIEFTEQLVVTDPRRDPDEVVRLERDFARLRTAAWWAEVTPGLHARNILVRYQQRHALDATVARLSHELADAAARVQSAASERTNAYLALLTIVGAPFGVALQLAQLFSWTRLTEVAVVLVITLVCVALLAASPMGRPLLKYLRQDG